MSELLLQSDLSLLNDRICNLSAGLATMPENGTMQVSKVFLTAVLGYMEELLGMRRAQPANEPKECPAMERAEGGIPYCADKQTACDGCKPANEPLTLEQLREIGQDPVWIGVDLASGHDSTAYCRKPEPERSENDGTK